MTALRGKSLAGVILLLTLSSAAVRAAATYGVLDLGTLGGTYSEARGINHRGEIVGLAANASGKVHGFLWRNGVLIDLGVLPGGDTTEAHAINNDSVIAGRGNGSSGPFRAVRWTGSLLEDLGTGVASNSSAYAINAAGNIVGDASQLVPPYFSFLQNRATKWSGGTPAIIGPQPPGGVAFSFAYGINASDRAVGSASDSSSGGKPHAAIFDSPWRDIHNGALGFDKSQARAVNESGTIVGFGWSYPSAVLDPVAFIWRETNGMTLLPALAGLSASAAYGINNRGDAVGYGSGGAAVPVLWSSNTIVELQSRIPTNSNWDLEVAYGINDDGFIVGYGKTNTQTHAILLYPTNLLARVDGRVTVLGIESDTGSNVLQVIENAEVTLSLVQGTNLVSPATRYTDANGNFSFLVLVNATNDYSLKLTLRDGSNRVAVYDTRMDSNNVAWIRTRPFTVFKDRRADISMFINAAAGDNNDNDTMYQFDGLAFTPTQGTNDFADPFGRSNAGATDFAHAAVIYRNTYLAADFAVTQLGVNMPLIPVRAFWPGRWSAYSAWAPVGDGTNEFAQSTWQPPVHFSPSLLHIVISDIGSAFNEPFVGINPLNTNGWSSRTKIRNINTHFPPNPRPIGAPALRNRPFNREFHEYSHYIMQVSPIAGVNQLPPSRETVDGNGNGQLDVATNHMGLLNYSSADSWVEGFAEFMAMVIAEHTLDTTELPISGDYIIYGTPLNLDADLDFGGDVEELIFASLLWDLFDSTDAAEADNTHLTLSQLWGVLQANTPPLLDFKAVLNAYANFATNNPGILGPVDLEDRIVTATLWDDLTFGFGDARSTNIVFDAGEATGVTSWNTNFLHRRHFQPPTSWWLELNAADGTGRALSDVQLVVGIEHDAPFQHRDRTYNVNVPGEAPWHIPIFLPPQSSRARIKARKAGLADSSEKVITSDFFRSRQFPIRPPESGPLLAQHTFVLASTGTDLAAILRASVGNSGTVTYTAVATNLGTIGLTGVKLTNELSSGVTFVSATPSQGSCTVVGGTITCSLGNVGVSNSATIQIIVTATTGSNLTNTLSVAANEPDTYTANNNTSLETVVSEPPVLVSPVLESGTCRLTFATLSGYTYVVEFKSDLNAPEWIVLDAFEADGPSHTTIDIAPSSTMRFYRVRIQ